MELDQEKLTRNESERSRELAQRIRRELQVLGGVGALESALEATGAVQPAEGALPELLVVVDPEWVTLPQQLADRVLLVCSEETMLAACAKQLAQQGLYRDFSWQSRGRALQTALFCRTDAPDAAGQLAGYEEELDILRERMELAERTGEEQGRQLERLRSDLSLSRSHEQDLEKTLNSVVQSQFWKLTWPMRYLVSKCRQLWHTFPLFVFLATLRRVGISGVMAQAKAKREYKKLFPGKAMPADHFATPELLVKQAANQPAGPLISIVVPLYNTPQQWWSCWTRCRTRATATGSCAWWTPGRMRRWARP